MPLCCWVLNQNPADIGSNLKIRLILDNHLYTKTLASGFTAGNCLWMAISLHTQEGCSSDDFHLHTIIVNLKHEGLLHGQNSPTQGTWAFYSFQWHCTCPLPQLQLYPHPEEMRLQHPFQSYHRQLSES